MAIYSRTQIPKWQAPIRITRPYIKPNYLADTITSAIQGYGSIQNMNLQQQLFNAKLAQQQKAQQREEATQAAYQQLIQQQIGTPAGPPQMVSGPHMDNTEMMTGYATTPAVPGMNPMQSIAAAVQANPGADMSSIMKMAAAINTMQSPNKIGGLTPGQILNHQWRVDRARITDAQKKAALESLQGSRDSTQAKNAATIDSLRRKDMNIFGELFDKEVATWLGLKDWDTPWLSGGWDKSGAEALEAFGATPSNPEWAAMKQKATELYMLRRSLGHDESIIKREIFNLAKKALVPDSGGISHRVRPNEAAALMQAQINEYSGRSTEQRAANLGIR